MVYTGIMTGIGQLISDGYIFAQGIVGICAFFMLVYAGILLLNPAQDNRQKAIAIIQDVVIGVILLFSAYVILNTINHDLVNQPLTSGLPQRP